MYKKYVKIEEFLKRIDKSVDYQGSNHLVNGKRARRWFDSTFKSPNNRVDIDGNEIFEDEYGLFKEGTSSDRVYRTDKIEEVIKSKRENIQKEYFKNTVLDEEKIKNAEEKGIDPEKIIINGKKLTEHRIPKEGYSNIFTKTNDELEFNIGILNGKQENLNDSLVNKFEELKNAINEELLNK